MRKLRSQNTQQWREAYDRIGEHQEKRTNSLLASGVLFGGTAAAGLTASAVMATAAPAALVAIPTVGAGVGAAAGLIYLGKAIYHKISEGIVEKEMRALQSMSDKDLVEADQARKEAESVGLWDRAMAALKTEYAPQEQSAQENGSVLRQREG